MILEWQDKRTDERGYRSVDNRYSICSVTQGGIETWQTWRLAPGGPWFAPLAIGLATEDDARATAQTDAETRVA